MGVIYLVRHGQAQPDAYGALVDSVDQGPLTELGRRQAEIAGRALAIRMGTVDEAVCGDLRRHRDTLALITQSLPTTTPPVVNRAWNEYDLDAILGGSGAGASMTGQALQNLVDSALAAWVDPRGGRPPHETFIEFRDRCRRALADVEGRATSGRAVLVVASAGTISQVVAQIWGIPGRDWARLSRTMINLSVTKLLVGRSGISVASFNEHAHLENRSGTRLLTYR